VCFLCDACFGAAALEVAAGFGAGLLPSTIFVAVCEPLAAGAIAVGVGAGLLPSTIFVAVCEPLAAGAIGAGFGAGLLPSTIFAFWAEAMPLPIKSAEPATKPIRECFISSTPWDVAPQSRPVAKLRHRLKRHHYETGCDLIKFS
jgi:hypothetical protein